MTTVWTTGQTGFDPRHRQKNFFSSLCVQTSSEAHPASYPMGTNGPFPEDKTRPRRDADNSPPSTAEAKNEKKLYLLSTLSPALLYRNRFTILLRAVTMETDFHSNSWCIGNVLDFYLEGNGFAFQPSYRLP
jgi:hypothetical protein